MGRASVLDKEKALAVLCFDPVTQLGRESLALVRRVIDAIVQVGPIAKDEKRDRIAHLELHAELWGPFGRRQDLVHQYPIALRGARWR